MTNDDVKAAYDRASEVGWTFSLPYEEREDIAQDALVNALCAKVEGEALLHYVARYVYLSCKRQFDTSRSSVSRKLKTSSMGLNSMEGGTRPDHEYELKQMWENLVDTVGMATLGRYSDVNTGGRPRKRKRSRGNTRIMKALYNMGWSLSEIARLLGISRQLVHYQVADGYCRRQIRTCGGHR
jgi:hypothetical protein